MAGRTWPVSGILDETGQVDDHLVFMSLEDAQQVLAQPGAVSLVELLLRTGDQQEEDRLVQDLNHILPPETRAVVVQGAARERQQAAARFVVLARFIAWVLLAAGALIVFTTQMGHVRQRRREIGILRAIGYRQRHIFTIVLGEVVVVAAAGGIFGYLIGLALQSALAPVILGAGATLGVKPVVAIQAVGLALASGLAAGFYPAWRAARLDPLEALR